MLKVLIFLCIVMFVTSLYLEETEPKPQQKIKEKPRLKEKESFNINDMVDRSWQKFSDEIAPYRFNTHGNPMKYGNYPGPFEQPIQAPKFNVGYVSPTLKSSNWM
jgi:hypothetical protein